MKPRPAPQPAPDPPGDSADIVDLNIRRAGLLFRRAMAGDVDACIEWLDRYYFKNRLPRQVWDYDGPD